MSSKSQLKKKAQAAAAAASRGEDEIPQMPHIPDKNTKYLWSGDPGKLHQYTNIHIYINELWMIWYIQLKKNLISRNFGLYGRYTLTRNAP